MKNILLLLTMISSTILLVGCTGHTNGSANKQKSNYNQIAFKCDAVKYRQHHPYHTSIKNISIGDTLVFTEYGSCSAYMTTVISVNKKNQSFTVEDEQHNKVKLKLNKNGNIIGDDQSAQEKLSSKYFVLGFIKSHGMFEEAL